MSYHVERLLILANTYPNPSSKYRETNCIAAINDAGQIRRLFPVPFRLLDESHRFKKWEWIEAPISRARGDNRPESHRIDVDGIIRSGESISTNNNWAQRIRWLTPHMLDSFDALENRRQDTGETIGILGPVRLQGLDIEAERNPEWTDDEITKLSRDGLFDTDEVRNRRTLRKLPFRFYYRYSVGGTTYRHLITDWEIGALYWNCRSMYGENWERYLRQKYEIEFAARDLLLVLGTVHRFPEQWLIISVVYPPKGAVSAPQQQSLFE